MGSNEMPVMEFKDIVGIIPHRHPFILVDKVLELKRGADYPATRLGSSIKAVKNVTINEPFFQGHFPHRPVLPGVLLIEIMAQVGALMMYKPGAPPQDVALVGIDKARFRLPVVPGDQMIIEISCSKDRGQIVVFGGKVTVDGQVVCEAELLAKVFDKQELPTKL